MSYNQLEFSEINNSTELLEDGVMLERVRCERTDIENMETSQLYGTPTEDAKVWMRLNSDCDDGILCGKYVADLLAENNILENNIRQLANRCGEFDEAYGSTKEGITKFIEGMGLEVSGEYNLTIKVLCESLDNNEKVICEISSILANYPEMSDFPGLSADRFVQVIGIDETNPDSKAVIVNDPFESCGGTKVNLDVFTSAWGKSDFYAVFAK